IGNISPAFWLNWTNGVNYNVSIQTPQYRVNSMDSLLRTPITAVSNAVNVTTPASAAGTAAGGNSWVGTAPSGSSLAYGNPGAMTGNTQMLSNLVSVERGSTPVIINH